MQLSSKSNSHPANFQIPSVNFRIPFYPQVKLHDDDDHSDAGHDRSDSESESDSGCGAIAHVK